MSWLGVKYALACRDERVKGGVRMVLVALGARVEYRRVTTSPTSLSELQWLTLLSMEQIRRNVDLLVACGKVVRLSRGKNAVYGLPEMAGPLFAVDDGDPVKMTDFVLDALPEQIGQNARKVSGRMPGFRRRMTDFSGRRAGGVLFSDPSTQQPSTSTAGDAEAAALLAWLRVQYPEHRNGSALSVTLSDVAALLRDVLVPPRDLERIRSMFIAMWTCTRDEDPFISQARDRGLALFRHTADRLDAISRARERRAAADQIRAAGYDPTPRCTHTPRCSNPWACPDHNPAASLEALG